MRPEALGKGPTDGPMASHKAGRPSRCIPATEPAYWPDHATPGHMPCPRRPIRRQAQRVYCLNFKSRPGTRDRLRGLNFTRDGAERGAKPCRDEDSVSHFRLDIAGSDQPYISRMKSASARVTEEVRVGSRPAVCALPCCATSRVIGFQSAAPTHTVRSDARPPVRSWCTWTHGGGFGLSALRTLRRGAADIPQGAAEKFA